MDSADEQAAAIRRELDGRMQRVSEMEKNRKLMPKFVLKEMESLYIEELKASINLLMANLESLPVSKGSLDSKFGMQKLKRYNHSTPSFLYVLSVFLFCFRHSRLSTIFASGELIGLDLFLHFHVVVLLQ